MLCQQHGKEVIGSCQWCGKPLCKLDIGKTMGKKIFCKKCSQELSSYIQTRQIEQIRKENEVEEKRKRFSNVFKM